MLKSQIDAERQYRQRVNDYTLGGLLATVILSVGGPLAFLYILSVL